MLTGTERLEGPGLERMLFGVSPGSFGVAGASKIPRWLTAIEPAVGSGREGSAVATTRRFPYAVLIAMFFLDKDAELDGTKRRGSMLAGM